MPSILVTTTLNRLIFEAPFEPFVHRWEQFTNALSTHEHETKNHLELLYKILKEELKDTIAAKEDFITNKVITYEYLWTIFQPHCIVYHVENGHECAVKFRSGRYRRTEMAVFFSLSCVHIDWDGKRFGHGDTALGILEFSGTKPITELTCFPLEYHPQVAEVSEKLIARGRLFEKYQGYHYMAYKGTAIAQGNDGPIKLNIDSRIIIDRHAHGRNNPNQHSSLKRLSRKLQPVPADSVDKNEAESVGKDTKVILCKATVYGYALKTKRWLEFFVDTVVPVNFNETAFESLVLPADQKELILAFAESQISNKESFDDVISGKGKGIIMLLSGGPGIGKTLTAESVAEKMKVPLFMMAAGDLGSDSGHVEDKLALIMEMVSKWNAVLLLDEADVFLEARSPHDLERNKIVSIFLRTLEYYEGILFLTTNRIDNMDAAFQSRIHITMEYPPLDVDSRKTVWNNFLEKLDGGADGQGHVLTEEEVGRLATVKLNGRQIKNILKAGQLLARRGKVALALSHLKTVLNVERKGAAAAL